MKNVAQIFERDDQNEDEKDDEKEDAHLIVARGSGWVGRCKMAWIHVSATNF